MKFTIRSLFIILLLIGSIDALSQLNLKEGSIITIENDTLHGHINDGSGFKNSKVCLFREYGTKEITEYTPSDLSYYWFKNDKRFISHAINHKNEQILVFLEVMLEGEINLYKYNISSVFYILMKDKEFTELTNALEPEDIEYDNKFVWKPDRTGRVIYKDTLFSYFIDCMPVLEELKNLEYNRKSLIAISKEYLRLTSQAEDQVTYESDPNIIRPKFGIYTGVQMSKLLFYDYLIDSRLTASVPIGVFTNIPISLISENISIQFEVIASKINYGRNFISEASGFDSLAIRSTSIGVPISINFEMNFNKFSPSIGLGKETSYVVGSSANYYGQRFDEDGLPRYGEIDRTLHKSQNGGWFADLGLKYKVNQKLSFYSSLRFQHYYSLIIKDLASNNSIFSIADSDFNTIKYGTYLGTLRIGIMF